VSVVSLQQVADATDADQYLPSVRQFVISGWPAKSELSPPLRPFWSVQSELTTTANGRVLLRGTRTVIPVSLRTAVLDLAHEGHSGIVRMKQRCRETVWYPGIDKDIEEYVRGCTACIVSGKSVSPTPELLQAVALPTGPWKKLSLDIAGEFVAAPHHQRFLIVAVDYHMPAR
jgi:hypothetical protein